MNASSGGQAVIAATRSLAGRWEDTQRLWADAKSREFDDVYMKELAAATERARPVFEQLQKLLTRVREDCE